MAALGGSHAIDRSLHPVVGLHRRVSRAWQWLASLAVITLAVAVGSYVCLAGYGFTVGAAEYLATDPERAACDNPASRFGWPYEAVNYDREDDARLLAYTPDPSFCGSQGETAGTEVRGAGPVPLAGWFIPSADGTGSTGRTIVLVHGEGSNKSGMLEAARDLHARYNLLLLDLRHSGRSAGTQSSAGLWEATDVRAMLDWLFREKEPRWVAVVGTSDGAVAALAEAVGDRRVRALVLDSMHATVEQKVTRLVVARRLPPWPAVPALIAGASGRVGADLRSVDPVGLIALVGSRPILLTHGTDDTLTPAVESLEVNARAARAAGVDLRSAMCEGAGHGEVVTVCGAEWSRWVIEFLEAIR